MSKYSLKYRRLNVDELLELEQEFIHFLVVNGVEAKDWVNIRDNQPDLSFEYIDQFSDMVLERALTNIRYVEMISDIEMILIDCEKESFRMISVSAQPDSGVDFTKPEALIPWDVLVSTNTVKAIRTDNPYTRQRELQVFDLIEGGFSISDGKLFNAFDQVRG